MVVSVLIDKELLIFIKRFGEGAILRHEAITEDRNEVRGTKNGVDADNRQLRFPRDCTVRGAQKLWFHDPHTRVPVRLLPDCFEPVDQSARIVLSVVFK